MLRRALVLGIVIAAGVSALRSTLPTAADDRTAVVAPRDERQPARAEPTSGRIGVPTTVQRVLAHPASLDFDDVRLKDFAPKLAAQLHINVVLDRKALAEANIPDEFSVSLHCHEMPLGHSLRRALSRRGLGFITLTDDTLQITTEEQADKQMVVGIYDVRDLVGYYSAPDPSGHNYADYDQLIDLITSIVAPSKWDSTGGAGPIAPYLGCLFISQSEEVQDQIARLLIALRKARDAGPDGGKPIVVDGPSSPLAAAIDAKLDTPQDVHFPGGRLPVLVKWLKQLGIPPIVDDRALADQGSIEAALDRLNLQNVPLGWALRRLLNQHQLDYLIADDGLVITTQEIANRSLETVVHPLGALASSSASQADAGSGLNFDELIEFVQAAVDRDSWDDKGGTGSIAPYTEQPALVCDHTHESQKRIAKVLAALRASVKQSAQAHGSKSGAAEGPPPLMVSVYHLSPLVGNNRIEASPRDVDRYVKIIRDLIEPRSWNDGTGYIAALPGAIVVRQTPAVQDKICSFLAELNALGQIGGFGAPVVKPPPTPAAQPKPPSVPDTTRISNGLGEKTR